MKRMLGKAMPKGVRSRRRSTADMRGDAAQARGTTNQHLPSRRASK